VPTSQSAARTRLEDHHASEELRVHAPCRRIARHPGLAGVLGAYFEAKSAHDPGRTTDYYRSPETAHVDVPLAWTFDGWDSISAMFATYMPQWPDDAVSAPSRIGGNDRGAVVFFTNSAGMSGESEIRSVGVVSFEDGKITRWADHWDARHFGLANFDAMRTPDAQYPQDFREELAWEPAEPAFAALVDQFAGALCEGDWTTLSSLLAPRVTFTDHRRTCGSSASRC
jgi:hypothetical protein